MNGSKKIYFTLAAILLLGAFLRLYGITWGLPSKDHFFSYVCDEFTWIRWVSNLNPAKLAFNPDAIQGNLFIYIYAIFLKIASLIKFVLLSNDPSFYHKHPQDWANIYLVGRILSFMFGMSTLYITFLIGKRFYSNKVGLFSVFLLSIASIHVLQSQLLLTNSVVSFWVVISLFFSLLILTSGSMFSYIMSGVCIGLAFSTKQNSMPLVITIIVSDYLRKNDHFSFRNISASVINKEVILTYLSAFLVFLLVNPFFFFKFKELYWNGNIRIYSHYLGYRGSSFFIEQSAVVNWLLNMLNSLFISVGSSIIPSIGLPLFLAIVGGLVWSLFKGNKVDILLLSFFLPYLFVVLYSRVLSGVYYLPILPIGIIFCTRFMQALWIRKSRFIKFSVVIIAIFVSFYTFFYSLAYQKLLAKSDVRQDSSEWILENIPEGSRIGVIHEPYWDSPNIIYNQFFYSGRSQYYFNPKLLYQVEVINPENLSIDLPGPSYLISSNWYLMRFVSGQRFSQLLIEETLALRGYKLIKYFDYEPDIAGIKFKRPELLSLDLSQISPRIYIFKRVYGK